MASSSSQQKWIKRTVINPYTQKEVSYEISGVDRFQEELEYDVMHILSNEEAATRTYSDPEVTLVCQRVEDKEVCKFTATQIVVSMSRTKENYYISVIGVEFEESVAAEKKEELIKLLNEWLQDQKMTLGDVKKQFITQSTVFDIMFDV